MFIFGLFFTLSIILASNFVVYRIFTLTICNLGLSNKDAATNPIKIANGVLSPNRSRGLNWWVGHRISIAHGRFGFEPLQPMCLLHQWRALVPPKLSESSKIKDLSLFLFLFYVRLICEMTEATRLKSEIPRHFFWMH